MSNKREITKIVVNNVVGFGIGRTARTFVDASIPKTGNPVVDTAIGITTLMTAWAVSSTVANPVRTETDRQIDSVFDAFETIKKNKNDLKQSV